MFNLRHPGHEALPQTDGSALGGTLHHLANLIPSPRSSEESLPRDWNPVVDRTLLEQTADKSGSLRLDVYTMQNHRQYETLVGVPRVQQSDYPIVMSTALGTSVRGHVERLAKDYMQLGFPVIAVGPEGGHAQLPKTTEEALAWLFNICTINLDETAGNIHQILNAVDADELYQPGRVITTGISRGGGVAIGVAARAQEFKREPIFVETVGTPFSEACSVSISELALNSALEAATLFTIPFRIGLKRSFRERSTINVNPNFLLHCIATIPSLTSGVGGEMAGQLDHTIKMHNIHFKRDSWSNYAGWQRRFAGYNFVINELRKGKHASVANRSVEKTVLRHFGGLRDELQATHNNPELVEWRNVHIGKLALVA